jgi:uncharacterized protein (TIGR02646 family)
MVPLVRGPEPGKLPALAAKALVTARQRHGQGHAVARADLPASYRQLSDELWRQQHFKCAYCEAKEQQKRNDVEHFRPAGKADRMDGTKDAGYWWLAYEWRNLLFACRNCNQSPFKLDKFPLLPGSVKLQPEDAAPGYEKPVLIDPYAEDPSVDLGFTFAKFGSIDRWHAWGRTVRGTQSIAIFGLNRGDLLDFYKEHVHLEVEPAVLRLRAAMARPAATPGDVAVEWNRVAHGLFYRRRAFIALAADALSILLTAAERQTWQIDPHKAMRIILAQP